MATVLDNVDLGAWGAAFNHALTGATSIEGRRTEALQKISDNLGGLFAVASEAEAAGVRTSVVEGVLSSTQSAVDVAVNQLRTASTVSQIDTLRSKAIGVINTAISQLEAKIDARNGNAPSGGGGGGGGGTLPDTVPTEDGPSTGVLVGVGLGLGALGLWLMYQRRGL